MSRNHRRWLGFVAAFLFIAFVIPAYGENYISKEVPPDDVLIRNYGDPKAKIIGKFQESEVIEEFWGP